MMMWNSFVIDSIPYGHGIGNSELLAIHTAPRDLDGFKNLKHEHSPTYKKDQVKYHENKF